MNLDAIEFDAHGDIWRVKGGTNDVMFESLLRDLGSVTFPGCVRSRYVRAVIVASHLAASTWLRSRACTPVNFAFSLAALLLPVDTVLKPSALGSEFRRIRLARVGWKHLDGTQRGQIAFLSRPHRTSHLSAFPPVAIVRSPGTLR